MDQGRKKHRRRKGSIGFPVIRNAVRVCLVEEEEAHAVVLPLAQPFLAKHLISLRVRGALELAADGEMGLLGARGPPRFFAIFEQEQVAEPRDGRRPEGSLAIRRPDVDRGDASSVRLLKVLPNDGPTCALHSTAATRRPPAPASYGADRLHQR